MQKTGPLLNSEISFLLLLLLIALIRMYRRLYSLHSCSVYSLKLPADDPGAEHSLRILNERGLAFAFGYCSNCT